MRLSFSHWRLFGPMFVLSGLLLIVVIAAIFLLNQAQRETEQTMLIALSTAEAYAELEKTTR